MVNVVTFVVNLTLCSCGNPSNEYCGRPRWSLFNRRLLAKQRRRILIPSSN
jgi:hypothetical protein